MKYGTKGSWKNLNWSQNADDVSERRISQELIELYKGHVMRMSQNRKLGKKQKGKSLEKMERRSQNRERLPTRKGKSEQEI